MRPVLKVLWICFIVKSIAGELICSNEFNFDTHSHGGNFNAAISERSYDCNCRGTECEQITCVRLDSGNVVERGQTCRDPSTGRRYARGNTFLRRNKSGVTLACVCPESGSLKIKCKRTQCVIPPPPPPSDPRLSPRPGFCYDPHNDNYYPHNIPYTRRVIMSYLPDLIGEYRCICTAISSRCTAIDIPCCDSRTGNFVAKDQRFVADIDAGFPMSCVCLGGRGRIGSCEALNDRRELEQGERVRRKRCLDPASGRYYREGSMFIQYKRNGDKQCTCKRVGKRLKIICVNHP